jgi:nucleoside-diphosphate-sugar epimerase
MITFMYLECASADHPVAVTAIINGIRSKPAGSPPGFLIHTSGTGILGDPSQDYGLPPDRVYDDISDIKVITSFSIDRWHRNIDKIVIDAATDDLIGHPKIKTAIVCPPTIYGAGIGPVRKRSVQLPELANASLRRGKALTVCQGENEWRHVHVADLADAYVVLVEEALKGGGKADWNADGYYFVENGQHVWKDVAKAVATDAFEKGYLKTTDVEQLTVEECFKIRGDPIPGPAIWGVNSLGIGARIRRLGWEPRQPALWDFVSEAVDVEAKALGMS